jgi:uncharacterized membrane protein YbhN (UPF0104 family)
MWLLARAMGIDIPLIAAFAVMAFTGVLITLPNSPGLVAQFEAGIVGGLGAYLAPADVASKGVAYALVLHGCQVVWYVGVGLMCLPWAGGAKLGEVVADSQRAALELPDAREGAL